MSIITAPSFKSLLVLFLLLFLSDQAVAQGLSTPAAPQQVNYQGTRLTDQTTSINLSSSIYSFEETEQTTSLQAVKELIQGGSYSLVKNNASTIQVGYQGRGKWIIFPIVNNSTQSIWNLDLGGIGDGKFATYKEITLYNMNSKKVILSTSKKDISAKSVSNTIQIDVPIGETTFFILYLKPNIGIPLFTTLTLQNLQPLSPLDIFKQWFTIILGFSAFIYFFKTALDHRALPHIFLAALWLSFSIPIFLSTNYAYISSWDMELLYPMVWVFSSLMIMLTTLVISDARKSIPTSFLGGITGVFLISGLAGITILKSIPGLALYLIYIPIVISCSLCSFIGFSLTIRDRKFAYLPLAHASLFLTLVIFWNSIIYFGIIPPTALTLKIPEILLQIAIIGSIIGTMATNFHPITKHSETVHNVFSDNQLSASDTTRLIEAKEQSEHHRLMQVIEQERKLMSDLQVKSAQQTEEMRRAKEAADEANRAKSAFLAIVSHEIRTPMTGIMGMLRLLRETQLSREQKEYASTIKDSGDAMLALLNDILDFEKIESGKMDLEDISFDLKRLIRGVHTLMRGHAESKNVELVLEIDDNTPTWVRGDSTRLRQVLLNLINNAIKFTSKGAVYLRTHDLTGESENPFSKVHQVYFAVQDSGIGISPESQKKLFMPFAQADSSISRKYGGTGLGLAICKRLIEAMGGSISISSRENEGSTFFFTLSMPTGNEVFDDADSFGGDEDSLSRRPALSRPIHTLIVDDNGINQKVVAGFVQKLGGTSKVASTGADALDLLAQYKFDVIILDIQLPDMNGLEVTHIIRNLADQDKARIPIVALTGNTAQEDIDACYAAGMNDFAAKPITFEKVAEILKNADINSYVAASAGNNLNIQSASGTVHDALVIDLKDNANALFEPYLDHNEEDAFELTVKHFDNQQLQQSASAATTPPMQLSDFGLDENILSSLKSGLSSEQIQDILVSFYEKADELISEIGKAFLTADSVSLYARAHELKGMAGNFGFSQLSSMCAAIEKAAKEGQLYAAKDSIDHLGDTYAVSRGFLNKWLEHA
jgi:signal transduction histidine kinase/CheY-like chemotaxis protein/HPt (histidine-containing phosphotransfer) domain-containing protein